MAEVIYSDEQRPPLWVVLLVVALTGYSVWLGFKEGVWVSVVISSAVLLLTLLARLRNEVRGNAVVVSWYPLRKKVIHWNEIVSAEQLRYRPLRDYGGWGIKYSFKNKTWAYTMKGDRGVLLTLRSAKPLLLGSDHPEELAAAINGILTPTSPTERAER